MNTKISRRMVAENIIKNILVENLFGYYTYEINGDKTDRLLILYGDNGSGKTTILKLVYYLLSTELDKGHKSILANTRFKKIAVTLSSGVIISAERTNDKRGSFKYSIRTEEGEPIISCILESIEESDTREFIIPGETRIMNKEYLAVTRAVKSIGISLYFLKDDRSLMTTSASIKPNSIQIEKDIIRTYAEDLFHSDKFIKSAVKKDEKISIEAAFHSLREWIRTKAIKYANAGETDNQAIYFDLVKSMADNRTSNEIKLDSKIKIVEQLRAISILNANLAEVGLVSDFDYYSLSNIVNNIGNPDKLSMISNVLTPFIEGSTAKINALTGIYNTIISFTNNVNDYFHDKRIFYHLQQGFRIKHYSGDDVTFSELSSGEQHLLHLWINAITAEDATVFIIDEPEISLNIKWQRKLLESLLNYTENRKIQFIIATHSIELITNNYDSVVKLVNTKSGKN